MDVIILVLLSIAATGFGAATVILNNSRKDLTKKLTDKKLVALSEEEAIEKASIKAKNIILEADQEVSKLREKNFEQIFLISADSLGSWRSRFSQFLLTVGNNR